MARFRFSIAGLLAVILLVGVAVAALRAADDAWDGGLFGLTLLALLAAVLLAVHRTDRRRAYWLGFAVFGWTYLVASLIPPIEARLPTTRGLAYLGSFRPGTTPAGVTYLDFDNDGTLDLLFARSTTPGSPPATAGTTSAFLDVTTATGPPPNARTGASWFRGRFLATGGGGPANFVRIGHSLTALLLGALGGLLSRRLRERRHDRGDPESGPAVHQATA